MPLELTWNLPRGFTRPGDWPGSGRTTGLPMNCRTFLDNHASLARVPALEVCNVTPARCNGHTRTADVSSHDGNDGDACFWRARPHLRVKSLPLV